MHYYVVIGIACLIMALVLVLRGARFARDEQAQLRMVADQSLGLIWVTDARGTLTFVNRMWRDFVGDRSSWSACVHPEDCERIEGLRARSIASHQPFSLEYRLQRADGEYRTVLDHGAPRYRDGGDFLGYVGTCIDITDRKRTETRLRDAAKMEALGRMAGEVAHDFGNILMAVHTLTELTLRDLDPDSSHHHDLQAVLQATQRAQTMIRQLMSFSAQRAGVIEDLNLNVAIGEALTLARPLFNGNIALDVRKANGLGWVAADPTLVGQLFLNLFVNAKDAMPEGGTLRIRTRNAFIREARDLVPGPYAQVHVADTGLGMPPEVLTRVFEPYFTTKAHGTGIGLANVYSYMRKIGGTIEATSVPGAGSEFTLLFPQLTMVRTGETILVVDDDPLVRRTVVRMLSEAGYGIHEATQGKEALECCGKELVHLVLTDIVMPEMNGTELCIALRSEYPQLPIVLMSGFAPADAELRLPDVPFLRKPFDMQELLSMIRQALM